MPKCANFFDASILLNLCIFVQADFLAHYIPLLLLLEKEVFPDSVTQVVSLLFVSHTLHTLEPLAPCLTSTRIKY